MYERVVRAEPLPSELGAYSAEATRAPLKSKDTSAPPSYLMKEAIRGHQKSSEVIRGHQRSSEVIKRHS